MPSETSIANAALTLLGERRIDSLEDSTKTARLLKERFTEVRNDTLRAYPWNFATKRAAIPKDVIDPVWGFDNAYTLPTDCLRLINVNNPGGHPYRIEGRKIVTDIGAPLQIEYTAEVNDAQEMDVLFRQAFAAALAADVAEAVTGTSTKVEELQQMMRQKMSAARTPDAQESTPRVVEASEWLFAREEGDTVGNVPSGSGTPL